MPLTATEIDPRDETWEEHQPAYRVHFWRGNDCHEWQLTGCDVTDALRWAEEHADGRTFVLYCVVVRVPTLTDVGLVRLVGEDSTRSG